MTPAAFRAALRDVDLKQVELATRLGVAPNTVNRWAKGELPVPRYAEAYLELLSRYQVVAFGLSLSGRQ